MKKTKDQKIEETPEVTVDINEELIVTTTHDEEIETVSENVVEETISNTPVETISEPVSSNDNIQSLHDAIALLKEKITLLENDCEQKNTKIIKLEQELNQALNSNSRNVDYSGNGVDTTFKVNEQVRMPHHYGSLPFTITSLRVTPVYDMYSTLHVLKDVPEYELEKIKNNN